jgi:hypothetical protein
MKSKWIGNEVELNSVDEVFQALQNMRLTSSQWVYRGESKEYQNELFPSIDRPPFNRKCDRKTKIEMERQSIELFRSTYKLLATSEESDLLKSDITSLMLMQHYGTPTRLLDWSYSPYIAAYFAVYNDDGEYEQKGHGHDGFIWGFDYDEYLRQGDKQWKYHKEMREKNNMQTYKPAFLEAYEGEWFVCQFLYQVQFPRILAQDGLFTFYSQFNVDHALIIQDLLKEPKYFQRYRIRAQDKMQVRKILREKFNIWHGMIYPDSTGVAVAIKEVLRDNL